MQLRDDVEIWGDIITVIIMHVHVIGVIMALKARQSQFQAARISFHSAQPNLNKKLQTLSAQ